MNSHDPKYEVGDYLLFKEEDRWGIVILIRVGFGTKPNEYFMDLYPGAVGHWEGIRAICPDGSGVQTYLGNWVEE